MSIAKLGYMSDDFLEMYLEVVEEFIQALTHLKKFNKRQTLDIQSILLTLHLTSSKLSPKSESKNISNIIANKCISMVERSDNILSSPALFKTAVIKAIINFQGVTPFVLSLHSNISETSPVFYEHDFGYKEIKKSIEGKQNQKSEGKKSKSHSNRFGISDIEIR